VRRVGEAELVDPLVLDVLQVLAAEVDDLGARRRVVPEQRARRLRHQDLAAMTGGADPRGAHDVQPEVTLLADRRLAGVQAHPHAHDRVLGPPMLGERLLRGDGRGDGVARTAEGIEEGVALRVDLGAGLGGKRIAHDSAVVADHVAVAVAEPPRAVEPRCP
jgi:hypothetical protein